MQRDIQFSRAAEKMKALNAAGAYGSPEYSGAVDSFIRSAPADVQNEFLSVAIDRGYCPAASATLAGGAYLWDVRAVAAHYQISVIEADKRLSAKGAGRYVFSDRGII